MQVNFFKNRNRLRDVEDTLMVPRQDSGGGGRIRSVGLADTNRCIQTRQTTRSAAQPGSQAQRLGAACTGEEPCGSLRRSSVPLSLTPGRAGGRRAWLRATQTTQRRGAQRGQVGGAETLNLTSNISI